MFAVRARAFAAPLGRGVQRWLLVASLLAFFALTLNSVTHSTDRHVHSTPELSLEGLEHWAWMVIAMMLPLLAMPITTLRAASHLRLRNKVTVLFIATYIGLWVSAGLLLVPVVQFSGTAVNGLTAWFGLLLGCLVWSASPWGMLARRRCHKVVRISGVAPSIYADTLKQAWVTTSGCMAFCWPWMLACQLTPGAHLVAMIIITIYLFADRIAPLDTARWRIPPGLVTIVGEPATMRRRPSMAIVGK